MKISPINFSYTNFTSRNCRIRKADDIRRISDRQFPMLSSTYVRQFYGCVQRGKKNQYEALNTRDKLTNIIGKMREETDNKALNYSDFCIRTLEDIKRLKVGNCGEATIITLAALAANGIYDVQLSKLGISIEFKDKRTGKTVYKKVEPIDHSMVVTALDKPNPNEKDCIVIDSWLGFTDSISGAKNRYKKIFDEKEMSEEIRENRKQLGLDEFRRTREYINYDNYELKTNILIGKAQDIYTTEDLKKLGKYCRKEFPELVINEQQNKKSIHDLMDYMSKYLYAF